MTKYNTQSFSSKVYECADGFSATYSRVSDSFHSSTMCSAGEREKVEVCFSLHHWLLYHFFQSDHGTAAAVSVMKYAGVLC